MTESGAESTVSKPQPKLESGGVQLLHELQDGAKSGFTSFKNTVSQVGQEIYDHPMTTLGTLAVGAAAIYLTRGEGAAKIAKALSKGEALDLKSLDVPSLFEKGGQQLERKLPLQGLKADQGVEHIEFTESGLPRISARPLWEKPLHAAKTAGSDGKSILADLKLDEPVKSEVVTFKATEQEARETQELQANSPNPESRRIAAGKENLTPELAVKLSKDSDMRVVREAFENPKMPPENLAAASTHPDGYVRDAVAKNPSTPPETLREMAMQVNDYGVPEHVLTNPSTPQDVREALQKKLDRDGNFLRKVTGDPQTDTIGSLDIEAAKPRTELGRDIHPRSEEEIRKLSSSDNIYDRQEAAAQRTTPEDVQVKLAADSDPDVKSLLVANDTTRAKALDVLAKDPDANIREQAAKHNSLSSKSASDLADDENLDVRRTAYRNPNMPPEKLTAAANDPDTWIRGNVVRNQSSPPEALRAVAERTDADWNTKRWIQHHKNTPEDVRATLTAEENRYNIARSETSTPEELAPLAKAPEKETRIYLAKHKHAPPDAMRTLADDPDKFVKNEALSSPNMPADALTKASTDVDDATRWAVAANPKTPPEILRAMAKDKSYSTRRFVQRNPSTPEDVVVELRLEK